MATPYERTWETRRGEDTRRGGDTRRSGETRRGEQMPRGGRSAGDEARDSYYGVPAIHKPHWNWLIVAYFFLGGIASGSYVVGTIAAWFGGAAGRPIARAGRYVSLAALLPCPPLLIFDLGRPERFLHMLRVFKLRSPMSVGVWGLLAFSGFATLSALGQAAEDGIIPARARPSRTPLTHARLVSVARVASLLGLPSALFLGGYTGVLLAATAVPLWTRNALLMGPLFLSSALSSGTAAVALVLSAARGTPPESLRRLERLDALALLAELGLLLTLRARLGPVIGRPLAEGRLGLIDNVGVLGLGMLAPLALQWRSLIHAEAPSRPTTALASVLTLTGGVLFRYVMVYAGLASADDPRATYALSRDPDADPRVPA